MLYQQLTISYECLSSIGNSLEIESMMSEIIITFSRKTGAVSGNYFSKYSDLEPSIQIGKKIGFELPNEQIDTKLDHYVFYENDKQIVLLPFRSSYAVFIYKNKEKIIKKFASMLGNFQHKINLSISACEGVKDLENLNEKLEQRVEESIEQIRDSEKLLIAQSKQAIMGEMIEMIAHQWRQPITTIGMISNNILFDIAIDEFDGDKITKELNKVNLQVSYLSKTIDDFRDFFKESKEQESVSVTDVLDGAMMIIDKHLEKQQIHLTINNLAKNIEFMTFKNELIQVILNILGNSKDAFENVEVEKKEISIDTEVVGETLCIKIRDNAGGIKNSILPKIFEPYFSTKKKKNGTGLGLYMSMIIVSEHLQGNIEVANVEKGVEFKILVPLKGISYE